MKLFRCDRLDQTTLPVMQASDSLRLTGVLFDDDLLTSQVAEPIAGVRSVDAAVVRDEERQVRFCIRVPLLVEIDDTVVQVEGPVRKSTEDHVRSAFAE